MDELLAALATQKLDVANDASRLKFQDTLRAAAQETETQDDTIMRLWDNVGTPEARYHLCSTVLTDNDKATRASYGESRLRPRLVRFAF